MSKLRSIITDNALVSSDKLRTRKCVHYFKANKLVTQLETCTRFLPTSASIIERLYVVLNEITQPMLCGNCGINSVTFINASKGYRVNCSTDCGLRNHQTAITKQHNCMVKHGVKHYSQTDKFKQTYRKTSLDRYGVVDAKNTPTARYNAEKTMVDKYGGWTLSSEVLTEKVRNTMINRYGVDHPMHDVGIRKTHLVATKTNQCQHIPPDVYEKLHNEDWLIHQHITLKKSLPLIAYENNVSQFMLWNNCRKYNIQPIRFSRSSQETKVYNAIAKYIDPELIDVNDRIVLGGKELDILIPTMGIAFEIHGLYWHNTDMPHMTSTYHQKKAIDCMDRGITLISLFEDQVDDNFNLVLDILDDVFNGVVVDTTIQSLQIPIQYMHIVKAYIDNKYDIIGTSPPNKLSIRNKRRYDDTDGPLFIYDCGSVTLQVQV